MTGYDDVRCGPGTRGFDGHLLKPIDVLDVIRVVFEMAESNLEDAKSIST